MSDTESQSEASGPTSDELIERVSAIIREAKADGTFSEMTKRTVREKVQEFYGVDLRSRKKWLNDVIQNKVDEIESSPPVSPSGKKRKKAAPPAVGAKEDAPSEAAASRATKKQKLADEDDDDDDEVQDDEQGREEDGSDAGDSEAGNRHDGTKDASDIEANAIGKLSDFSELEDDAPTRHRSTSPTKKKKRASASGTRPSTGSKKAGGGGKAAGGGAGSGDAATERLARLKSIVAAAGVRKPWKKLYANADVADDDTEGQCRIVQDVMREIGITGRGSIAEAKRIRAEREFQDEVAALQEAQVVDSARGRRASRSNHGAASAKSVAARRSSTAGDDESEGESEEDEGPSSRKSFKNSLASFAAGLNSDDSD
ncbi:uncharacterized protein PFL1_00760 [Pseudozyma flocculosa PF-1]|uniref:DEK-C domain-containing protein n=1 Tax=Pseudozyma flocculosa TaxID=84751 RepID=A0A5C3F2Q1_9BASI|nr:uncharacterized protein PFL1_00760 [Pseudozyma flocculosa PF-1]EPQ31425.1 hypothetical protein PFL1_00760 [Pseudozyma flocculosa PF-1]SPO38793.1 uncharacterized protein PSFLO_04272 [Pseudozyma flocculosa]